jgi:hypothetical protein
VGETYVIRPLGSIRWRLPRLRLSLERMPGVMLAKGDFTVIAVVVFAGMLALGGGGAALRGGDGGGAAAEVSSSGSSRKYSNVVVPGHGCSKAQTVRALNYARSRTSRQHWDSLVRLWNQESRWCYKADNPTSTAYGIPQAMGSLFPETRTRAWRNSIERQIAWGLAYIKQRYGNATAALNFHRNKNWY